MEAIRFKTLLLSTLFWALLATGCDDDGGPIEPTTGTISVTVFYQQAGLDSAFVVALSGSQSNTIVVAGTTDDGECQLSGVPAGNYMVSVSRSMEGFLIFGSLSSVHVSAGNTTSDTIEADQQAEDLFPLAVGNRWTYTNGVTDDNVIGVVGGKELLGVTTLRCGAETDPDKPDAPPFPFYMQRGVSAVYCYGWVTKAGTDHVLAAPEVWLDLEASEGECLTITAWGTTACCIEKGVTINVPAGNFTGCYLYRFTGGMFTGDYWLAPGVGMVRIEGDDTLELVSYELY